MLIEKQLPIFFNSAEATGAKKVGTLGNQFEVSLHSPIAIPQDAENCTIEVVQASVWNTSPNISPLYNNDHFYISYSGVDYDIFIPEGLYGVTELDLFFKLQLPNEEPELPSDLFEISSNDATQRCVVTFNYDGVSIDFTRPNTLSDIMGFTSLISGDTDDSIFADRLAGFNRITSYYILSTMSKTGIPQNQDGQGILTAVPITARVGSLINYSPFNPLRVNAEELIGNQFQTLNFRLVDQLLLDVSTGGEEWQLTVVVRFMIPSRKLKNMGNAVLGQSSCHSDAHGHLPAGIDTQKQSRKLNRESIKRQAMIARIAKRGMLNPTRG